MEKIKADPLALNAVICAALKGTGTMPEDFPRATLVDTFSMIYRKFPDWAEVTPGDFSILGMLENMHTLHFPNRREPIQVNDFFFLAQCRKLKRLDVAHTSFSDCSILPQLPPLNYVRLPEKGQLTHLEALDQLPKSTKVSFLPPSVPAAPPPLPCQEPEGSGRVRAIVEEIRRRTAMDCYRLTIQPNSLPGLFDSKFGGYPYWEPGLPYPTDSAGEKLVLLAQINLDQFPADEPLPQGGMLQFFAGQDSCFGIEGASGRSGGFRVVYHEKIDRSVTVRQLKPLGIPTHADVEYFPVMESAAVTMEKATAYMGPADIRFDRVFAQAFQAVTGEAVPPGKDFMDVLTEEDVNFLDRQFSAGGHHLLGYPYFVQDDPRDDVESCDTLLFQMDSDWDTGETYVMWGDAGVGNFFLSLEELKQRDFSGVYYTWDCG